MSKPDHGKPRFDLIDPHFTLDVAEVLTIGASRHGDNNWQLLPSGETRYLAALLRHINAIMRGEITDEDTGRTHYACATCNLMFLYYFNRNNPNKPGGRPSEGKHIPGHSCTGSPIYDPSSRNRKDGHGSDHDETDRLRKQFESAVIALLDKGGTYWSLRACLDDIWIKWDQSKLIGSAYKTPSR